MIATRQLTPYIIWWAIAVHAVWGLALIGDPSVPAIVVLVGLHWIVTLGVSGPFLGTALVVAACFAALGLMLGNRVSNLQGLALLLPQYFLLVAAFCSDFQTVLTGDINGQSVDRVVLLTALWPMMIAAVFHSLAIIERHRVWIRR